MASIRKVIHESGRTSWQARWRDPTGTQRSKNFDRRVDAERHLTTVEARKLAGTYVDPRAGRLKLGEFTEQTTVGWLNRRDSTKARDNSYLNSLVLPAFANASLGTVHPTEIQQWVAQLDADGYAPETAESMSPQAGLATFCVDYPYRGPLSLPSNTLDILEEMAPTYYSVFPVPEGFDPFSIPGWCERWPVGPDLLPSPLSGEGAGPVLVVTATSDAIAPTASAIALAEQLVNDTLLIVEDDRHISYDTTSTSPARTCATDLIDDFLITLTAPPDGTICGP